MHSSRSGHLVVLLLPLIILSSAGSSRAQSSDSYDAFLNYVEGILNGSIPLGKIDSILFTQANRYNLALSNNLAKYASPTQTSQSKASSSSSSSTTSRLQKSSTGPSSRSTVSTVATFKSSSSLFRWFQGNRFVGYSLSSIRNSIKWLSSNSTASAAARGKLKAILGFFRQPNVPKALGTSTQALFIAPDANVTKLSDSQYQIQEHDDGDNGDSGDRHRSGRGGDDDDDDVCYEPTGNVRIIKYTSPQNESYVKFYANSKCLPNVRKVEIRNAQYGQTGPLVMEVPGSWMLIDDDEYEVIKHTFIANASAVTVANGQDMETAINAMTKKPWEYYAIFTTGSKPSGEIRGQFWKPFCPWCANFTFTGSG